VSWSLGPGDGTLCLTWNDLISVGLDRTAFGGYTDSSPFFVSSVLVSGNHLKHHQRTPIMRRPMITYSIPITTLPEDEVRLNGKIYMPTPSKANLVFDDRCKNDHLEAFDLFVSRGQSSSGACRSRFFARTIMPAEASVSHRPSISSGLHGRSNGHSYIK